jgi:hypothetical protein
MQGSRLAGLGLLAVAAVVQGCSSDGGTVTAGLPPLDKITPSMPSLGALLPAETKVVGSPIEVYTRVSRGALTCWFGASGPLKGTYIYHGEADPPSRGSRAEFVIHTRDKAASDPRSVRAFRVGIAPGEQKTQIEVENISIPEPLAARLKADVIRWAGDQEGCGENPVTTGWSAADTPAPPSSSKKAKR